MKHIRSNYAICIVCPSVWSHCALCDIQQLLFIPRRIVATSGRQWDETNQFTQIGRQSSMYILYDRQNVPSLPNKNNNKSLNMWLLACQHCSLKQLWFESRCFFSAPASKLINCKPLLHNLQERHSFPVLLLLLKYGILQNIPSNRTSEIQLRNAFNCLAANIVFSCLTTAGIDFN